MAITFDIPNTEIVVTTGTTEATCQEIHDASRLFESTFAMMGLDHIVDASGKALIDPGTGLYSEILLVLRDPWTVRFEDESSAHCAVKGGTLLAFDAIGDPRPVSTNYGLTVYQSVSGTLITGSGDAAAIAAAVWDKLTAAHVIPGSFGKALQDLPSAADVWADATAVTLAQRVEIIKAISAHRVEQLPDGTHIVYAENDIDEFMRFIVQDANNNPPTLPDGIPAKRSKGVLV